MTVIGTGKLQTSDSKEFGNLDLVFFFSDLLGLREATMTLALEYGILVVHYMERKLLLKIWVTWN